MRDVQRFSAQALALPLSVLLLLAGCGRATLDPPSGPAGRVLTLDAAIAEVEQQQSPQGADPAVFGELQAALISALDRNATQRWSSAAPSDPGNAVGDLYLTRIDDGTATAQWTYRNIGDYDLNSEVNGADIAPIAAHFRKTPSDPSWATARAADGDANGEVNGADIAPIASHFLRTVSGYAVQMSSTPTVETTWTDVGTVSFAEASSGPGRLTFSVDVAAAAGQSFRVVPLHGSDRGVRGTVYDYDGVGGPPEMPFEEREVILDAIADKFANLTGATSAEQDAELAAYIRSLPGIEEAGHFEGNAWGRFTDGRLAIVCKNRAPAEAESQSKAGSEAGVPENDIADLFNAFGPGTAFLSPINELSTLLDDKAYTSLVSGASVARLQVVQGGGLFYIDAHGGTGNNRDGTSQYCVWTDTPVTGVNDFDYHSDLVNNRLAYMFAGNAAGNDVWNYAFSDEFVQHYMSFSDNSMVFINACNSGNAMDMVDAFHAVGASVYLGWIISVPDNIANNAAKHLFDRLLGANELSRTEDPPIRPFNYWTTLFDMYTRGVSALTPPAPPPSTAYSNLIYWVKGGDPSQGFQLLAPTIQSMVMFDNADELRILGQFGDYPGIVTVGGTEVSVTQWDPFEVRCQLPQTGDGTSGDVVVEVRGHRSNPRQLSEWRGTITYTLTQGQGLSRSIDFNVHFRGDLNNWRAMPDTDPLIEGPFSDGVVTVFGALDSAAIVTAEGEFTDDDGYTLTWSNGPQTNIPIFYGEGDPPPNFSTCYGHIVLAEDKLNLNLYVFGEFMERLEDDMGEVIYDELRSFNTDLASDVNEPDGLPLTLDEDYNIEAGLLLFDDGDVTYSVGWSQIECSTPPDPLAAR